ncbi:MAG: hydroxymethylbilane synthase [SAR324 cluster bacterium]|nr:hydroxymethylbilane synthase [SAR324 cluster bacterium]
MIKLKIGSRKSDLATWQATTVKEALQKENPDHNFEMVYMSTTGDRVLDQPLYNLGGKGLFVKELEKALLDGRIDMAVHSLKDVPSQVAKDFLIMPVLKRANPSDSLINLANLSIDKLPDQAVIGTSSLRRELQLKRINPSFEVLPLRGNIQTRIAKLKDKSFMAIVLAEAGLARLEAKIDHQILSPSVMLPASGQGILAIEVLASRTDLIEDIKKIQDKATLACAICERAFLDGLGGDCWTPIASLSQLENNNNTINIKGAVFSPVGKKHLSLSEVGDINKAEEVGKNLAQKILAKGGGELLKDSINYYRQ